MKLAIAILLLAASSVWAQQSPQAGFILYASPPTAVWPSGPTPAADNSLSITQTWNSSGYGSRNSEAILYPVVTAKTKALVLLGGGAGSTELFSVNCAGDIKVRGKPYVRQDELADAVREWVKQSCPKGKP